MTSKCQCGKKAYMRIKKRSQGKVATAFMCKPCVDKIMKKEKRPREIIVDCVISDINEFNRIHGKVRD